MTLLVSLEDYAVARGVAFDPLDPLALFSLEAASEVVRRYTGQSFDLATDDPAHLNGTGTLALILPQRPVVEVTEVTVRDPWFDAEYLLLDTDWVLAEYGILLRADGACWPSGWGNVDVTYTHGFASMEEIPSDLRMAVCTIAGQIYSSSLASSSGSASGIVVSEAIGGYSVTYETVTGATSSTFLSMDDLNKLTLDTWRTPVLG